MPYAYITVKIQVESFVWDLCVRFRLILARENWHASGLEARRAVESEGVFWERQREKVLS